MKEKILVEEAMALGFDSIEQCEEHQAWLNQQRNVRAKTRAAIKKAEKEGSNIIDVRHLLPG